MSMMIGRERSLQRALARGPDDYDFVCIDTPPSLGLLTVNALTAADKVIVPVQCEYLSMRGLLQLQNTLQMIRENLNPDVDIEGILPTLVDSRTIHAKEALEILEENFGDRVFASRIRKTVRFAEAPVKGMSVLRYEPDGAAAAVVPPTRAGGPKSWQVTSAQACATAPSPRSSVARTPSSREGAAAGGEAAAGEQPSPTRRAPRKAFNSETGAVVPQARTNAATRTCSGQAATAPCLRVVGVGGAGTNAVDRMIEAEVAGVEFLAVNTDVQSLQQSAADTTVAIGQELTAGRGSGSDPAVGRQAALADSDVIKDSLKGSDMVFVTAGSGGGTGSGAAPVVARIAREVGALTVGVVTTPFSFEGKKRAEAAERGIQALSEEVDTLIVVPNERLLSVLDKQTSMVEAFRVADDVLRQGVQGVSDLITLPGLINLDFADVCTIMRDAGTALLGIGIGSGEHRATEAAEQAVSSPLLETSMEGARSILLSITGGDSLSLWEVNEAAKAVSTAAHPDANIIFGATVDEKLTDEVWVTVVATGLWRPWSPQERALDARAGGRGPHQARSAARAGVATRRRLRRPGVPPGALSTGGSGPQ